MSGDESARRLRAAIEGLDVGVLVNNAGVSRPSMVYLHEADVEALVRMVRVNLWALTEVTAAVLPGMLERRRGAMSHRQHGLRVVGGHPLLPTQHHLRRH